MDMHGSVYRPGHHAGHQGHRHEQKGPLLLRRSLSKMRQIQTDAPMRRVKPATGWLWKAPERRPPGADLTSSGKEQDSTKGSVF